jgi:hypothetical protein
MCYTPSRPPTTPAASCRRSWPARTSRRPQGRPGTGRRRNGIGASRFPENRRDSQCRQLPFRRARGIPEDSAVRRARQTARSLLVKWAKRASSRSASAITANWRPARIR